jgi:uncharacterized protein YaaR (DUF327 family)
MIEIIQARGRDNEKNKLKVGRRHRGIEKSKESFSSELAEAVIGNIEGTIEEILDDLRDNEKKFLEYQSEYELMRYKATVQKILKLIIDESFRTKTLRSTKKNWGDFTIIEKINSKLLEITEAVTKKNKAFDLLKSIEEIRGLILDIVH